MQLATLKTWGNRIRLGIICYLQAVFRLKYACVFILCSIYYKTLLNSNFRGSVVTLKGIGKLLVANHNKTANRESQHMEYTLWLNFKNDVFIWTLFHWPLCSNMMTSSNGHIFRVTGPLCREFPGRRWIPLTKASDAELWCFSWSVSVWINSWANNGDAGDLRHPRAHYDVIVMMTYSDL